MSEGAAERWKSGDVYEPCVGRWSRLVVREFLRGSIRRPGLPGSMWDAAPAL